MDERVAARNGPKGERPNTVAGLMAKRAELAGRINFYESEIRKMSCDIDHLDAAIRLFNAEPDVTRVTRHHVAHRARKGDMIRFVLGYVRDADGPVTSIEITMALLKARGLQASDDTI